MSASVVLGQPATYDYSPALRLRQVSSGTLHTPGLLSAGTDGFPHLLAPVVVPSGWYVVEGYLETVSDWAEVSDPFYVPDWTYLTLIWEASRDESNAVYAWTAAGSLVGLAPFAPHSQLPPPANSGGSSGTGNQPGSAPTNRKFRYQMQTSGPVSLVEAKTSNDMLAIGEALVAPTVKTGDLLAMAKTAAKRAEINDPALAVLDYRRINGTVRASIFERSSGAASAVDSFRDAVIAGFNTSGESVRGTYTLEQTNGAYKLPGFFTPHDVSAEAPVVTAIMNAGFVEQQDVEYQRPVPSLADPNTNTETVSVRKKFTPDSIIARAIKLIESDARFAAIKGLVCLVDENEKKVHVLFIKDPASGQSAYDWRAVALPSGASAITLDVTVPAEPAPEAPAGFDFFA